MTKVFLTKIPPSGVDLCTYQMCSSWWNGGAKVSRRRYNWPENKTYSKLSTSVKIC